MAAAMPSVRTTRITPSPLRVTPAATGGRFGPRRTTSSRLYSTRTARPCSPARRRATSRTSWAALPPNAPPLANTLTGSPPGNAPRRVGFEVTGLDPCGAQRPRPIARGKSQRPRETDRRTPAGNVAGRGSRLHERLAHDPTTVGRPHRYERVERRRVVSEPALAERHGRPDALRHAPFDRGPSAGRVEVAGGIDRHVTVRHLEDGLPPRAAAQVREQGAAGISTGRKGGESHHDAGRAETALARTHAAERVGPARSIG